MLPSQIQGAWGAEAEPKHLHPGWQPRQQPRRGETAGTSTSVSPSQNLP